MTTSNPAATLSSETSTRGIRVRVDPQFCPHRSDPANNQWFFLYTVTITNESQETVQLLTRHWIITDATGEVQEVRGPGVVGEQPVLTPGASFEYTSGCPLTTDVGKMEGSYQMVNAGGEHFDVEIAAFTLCQAETIN